LNFWEDEYAKVSVFAALKVSLSFTTDSESLEILWVESMAEEVIFSSLFVFLHAQRKHTIKQEAIMTNFCCAILFLY
jgi:hypothetical protein